MMSAASWRGGRRRERREMARRYRFTVPKDYKIPGPISETCVESLIYAISLQAVTDLLSADGEEKESAELWFSEMPLMQARIEKEIELRQKGEGSELLLKRLA